MSSAARTRAIPVSNVPEYGTDSVAQYVLAVLLHFCHQMALHDRLMREGQWQRRGDFCFWETPLSELVGKRAGDHRLRSDRPARGRIGPRIRNGSAGVRHPTRPGTRISAVQLAIDRRHLSRSLMS